MNSQQPYHEDYTVALENGESPIVAYKYSDEVDLCLCCFL